MVTHMHIGFRVEDFERWKAGYDASVEHRRNSGEISYQVFRDVNDPNVVTVVSMQKTAEGVQALLDSPEIKEGMEKAGIVQMGKMLIVEEVDRGVL